MEFKWQFWQDGTRATLRTNPFSRSFFSTAQNVVAKMTENGPNDPHVCTFLVPQHLFNIFLQFPWLWTLLFEIWLHIGKPNKCLKKPEV